jgi:hypothetical protein
VSSMWRGVAITNSMWPRAWFPCTQIFKRH